MSAPHFVVECDDKGCVLRDLNSSNGTFLNGARVDVARLKHGDTVVAGDTTFLVQIADENAETSVVPTAASEVTPQAKALYKDQNAEVSAVQAAAFEIAPQAKALYIPMRLLTKFNLVLIVFLGAGALIIAHMAYNFLTQNARDQALQQAELMMASASATRNYTSVQVKPLLLKNPQHKIVFLEQVVPAFAASTTFNQMRKANPNYSYYSYREATLNPTNLVDRADDWETDIIRYFNDHPDEKKVVGERVTATGRQLYLAKPMPVVDSCMECHSTPGVAPAAMIKKYGSMNGFGWDLKKINIAQIVSVPMSVPIEVADKAFRRLIFFLVVTIVVTIVALDTALYVVVIRPLHTVSDAADRISKGETDLPEFSVRGKDEIAELTASFNRMRVSLTKALRMLEQ